MAVDYISSNMGSCHSLRVLTSQGNLLSSLNITTELTDKVGGVSCHDEYERMCSLNIVCFSCSSKNIFMGSFYEH